MKQILMLVCAGVVVSGCGQKGALYLPDKNASVVTRPAPAVAAPEPSPNSAPPSAPKQDEDKKDDSQSSNTPPR